MLADKVNALQQLDQLAPLELSRGGSGRMLRAAGSAGHLMQNQLC